MYRTLIVEDNAIFRYAIRTIINWEQQGFILAGEAVNGKQALERLEEQAVDLLITDISMPEMNGIELIQSVKQRSPHTQVIVLSSYDNFQFVKEALKLGAMDYLLKPDLEEETLLKALALARERILRERQATGMSAVTGRDLLNRLLVQGLLGRMEPSELEARAEELRHGFGRAPLAVIAMRSASGQPSDDFLDRMEDVVSRLGLVHMLVAPAPGRLAAVVSFGKERSETRLAAMAHQAATLFAAELRKLQLPGSVGLSRTVWGMKELPGLYSEAESALFRSVYKKEPRQAVYTHSLCPTKPPEAPLSDTLHDICVAMRSASVEAVLHHAGQWLGGLKKLQPEEAVLKRMWMDQFAFLVATATEKQMAIEDMEYWHRTVHESLTRLGPVEELHRLFVSRCLQVLGARETPAAGRKEINRAMDYIETHLHEEITVVDIAAVLKLSPNYLSNLFRQQTGKRLIEYVQERRVEAAKKLLADSPFKVYEVAEKVGFKDTSYFCKVFKEFTGMTVSDYRKSALR